MALFYAKVTGLEALNGNRIRLEGSLRLGLTESADAGADIVLKDAASRAPRLTGALIRGIRKYLVPPTGNQDLAIVQVGPSRKEFYGRFVEKGTKHSKAEPFLLPALEFNRARIIKTMHEKLWNAIRRFSS